MDLGLNERTVIVTGAPGGLGREIVRAFAAEGAHVVLGYRTSQTAAEVLAKELGERARAAHFDLTDPDSAQAIVAAALAWTGRVDALVNNAVSWSMDPDGPERFEEVAGWQDTLRANIEGAVGLTRAVAPVMREQRFGRLVHLSSTMAAEGSAGGEYYGAAKAALHGFNRSIAFSLGRDGDIVSNVAMPGLTRTDTNEFVTDRHGPQYADRSPLGRLLTATEVARPIVYLASAANTAVNGQVLILNGG
jgi:NAD(P)-dependent dehydrogenase (short-subunit alcohol dehydrogenase family)